jgi:hypothetical protein
VGRLVLVVDAVAERKRESQAGLSFFNFDAPFPNHIFRIVIPDAVLERIDSRILLSEWVSIRGIPQIGLRDIPEIVCSDASQL